VNDFEYRRARTLDEVLALLAERPEQTRVLAGGTDLLVEMRHRRLQPGVLVDPKGIPELAAIRDDPAGGVSIGALVTIHTLATSPVIRAKLRGVSDAAGLLGSRQVRSRATVGGNVCHASPAADMAPGLISVGARVRIVSVAGERSVPLEQFFVGRGRTVLGNGELLVSIEIPGASVGRASRYLKHSVRRAMDLAVVGVAVMLGSEDGDGRPEVRIVLGAAGPVPMRARRAEEHLGAQGLDDGSIAEAARLASAEARPVSDVRASADYRREMVRVLTARAVRDVRPAVTGRSARA